MSKITRCTTEYVLSPWVILLGFNFSMLTIVVALVKRRKSTYNAAIQCSFGQSNDLMDHASEDAEENEFQVFTTM